MSFRYTIFCILLAIYKFVFKFFKFVFEKIPEIAHNTLNNFFSKRNAEKERLEKIEVEVQKLISIRRHIKSFLKDAVEWKYTVDDSIRCWLSELRSLAFDIKDINRDFQTQIESLNPSERFSWTDFVDRIEKIKEYERVKNQRIELPHSPGTEARILYL